ncbi:MAG: AAA family ATPase [Lachnospiraceae bacterium]|nr:AAA family ATPase [Lachnospiraceae bacterium]
MQKICIDNFGPIKICEINVADYVVLTGEQASGKSTLAKSIYFFLHLKDVWFDIVQRNYIRRSLYQANSLEKTLVNKSKAVFTQFFGTDNFGFNEGNITFDYDENKCISIHLKQLSAQVELNICFSDEIREGIEQLQHKLYLDNAIKPSELHAYIDKEIFGIDMNVVYIPAGRSLLTMLSSQISYIYATMDDQQKRTIDYCTQKYLEEVLRIQDFFKASPQRLVEQTRNAVDYSINEVELEKVIECMQGILGGEYRNINGEERLYFDESKSVKLGYASSGQQEAVWILNILFYYMLGERNTCFIIEEPESHLFPDTQKRMVEFISLVKNEKHKVILTTHSPYVLGSINNLLCASNIANDENFQQIEKIISKSLWLKYENMGAYYIEEGTSRIILDDEVKEINHDVIDGVSRELNNQYDEMMDILWKERE